MNNNYPVNRKLRNSIDSIFEDPSVGLGFLGIGIDFLSNLDEGVSLVQRGDPIERICQLRDKLEDFVAQMAVEILELGEEEAPRIRAEATATLIILREIRNYFPEAFSELRT